MKLFFWLGILFGGLLNTSVAQETTLSTKPSVGMIEEVSSFPAKSDSISPTRNDFVDLYDIELTGSSAVKAPRLNPRAVSFVEDYMDKYSRSLQEMKGWALPYFNMMDGILAQYGLPRELKYLAVIESRLKASSVSWAGAVGPWQFMPQTAIRMGLKVNKKVDERTHYVKSTHAAAKYLKELYNQFGDWLLVIAAYNGGPGAVQRAIAKSGSKNFWDLQYYLPAESRTHVKKFIGTHYIFEGQGGITTLTKAETKAHYGQNLYAFNRQLSAEEGQSARTQQVSGKYNSVVIAKHISMDITEFNRYNPEFDRVMASSTTSYELKLPGDKMDLFNANKYQILQESVQLLLNSALSSK